MQVHILNLHAGLLPQGTDRIDSVVLSCLTDGSNFTQLGATLRSQSRRSLKELPLEISDIFYTIVGHVWVHLQLKQPCT